VSDLSLKRSLTSGHLDLALNQLPLLEIYSPIRADWTGDIIGVGEFYENASELTDQLDRARLQGWLITALVTALICLSLFGVVRGGSRTIMQQRRALATRLTEVESIASQNVELRKQIEKASRRLSKLSEANLRRVGADLHDGPAQLISLVALRLDAWQRIRGKARQSAYEEMRSALEAALAELRQISRGLVLPELEELALGDVIELAITTHEGRSHISVRRELDLGEMTAPESAKICIYRFVQEGLNNAFRHAGGKEQAVTATMAGGEIVVRVTNALADNDPPGTAGEKMGLIGLRDRVESLGGKFSFETSGGQAMLTMHLTLIPGHADD